jgi:HSP20 family protein
MLIMNRVPLAEMRNEVNQLFNSVLSDFPSVAFRGQRAATPPMNVWEDGPKYFIEAELPGFSLEDVEVSVIGNEVTIMGQRRLAEVEGATYLRRERNSGTFTRKWTLPADIAIDQVQASMNNGVLQIVLPKSEKAQPRKIEVKPAGK